MFGTNFKDLFKGQQSEDTHISPDDPTLDSMPILTQEDIQILFLPYSEKEIQEATFGPHPLKSPSPYGVALIFYQNNYMEVKGDIIASVNSFLLGGHILRAKNRTYITLTPKNDRPQELKDF